MCWIHISLILWMMTNSKVKGWKKHDLEFYPWWLHVSMRRMAAGTWMSRFCDMFNGADGEENETVLFQKAFRKNKWKKWCLFLTIPSPLHQMTAEQSWVPPQRLTLRNTMRSKLRSYIFLWLSLFLSLLHLHRILHQAYFSILQFPAPGFQSFGRMDLLLARHLDHGTGQNTGGPEL